MTIDKKSAIAGAAMMAGVILLIIGLKSLFFDRSSRNGPVTLATAAPLEPEPKSAEGRKPAPAEPSGIQSLELSPAQIEKFKMEPVQERVFNIQRDAVGNIDFNEDRLVQVFPTVAGKITRVYAGIGDNVREGMPLFAIDSPDLAQAESTLIGAAGVFDLTTSALKRAKELYEVEGIAQKDLNQAISDQNSAEGALKAAREAVRILGKSDAEIETIIAQHRIDPLLIVTSPVTGRIAARNAAPGVLVQPGNLPAPLTIADVSTMWMLANVAETDMPYLGLGESVKVAVKAYPGREFEGKIVKIGEVVDPNTHRVVIRSEVSDPRHELRPGMFTTFIIRTGNPVKSPALPVNGILREGDGTMSAWVTSDRKRMVKRTVTIGLEQDGYYQIVNGLKSGEIAASDGALFLSNLLTEGS